MSLTACGGGGSGDEWSGATRHVYTSMKGGGVEKFSSALLKDNSGSGSGTTGGTIEGIADIASVQCQFLTNIYDDDYVHGPLNPDFASWHRTMSFSGLNDGYIEIMDGTDYGSGPQESCADADNPDNCIVCAAGSKEVVQNCTLTCTGTVASNSAADDQYIPVLLGWMAIFETDMQVPDMGAVRLLMWPREDSGFWPELMLAPGLVEDLIPAYLTVGNEGSPTYANSIFFADELAPMNYCDNATGFDGEFKVTFLNQANGDAVDPAELAYEFSDYTANDKGWLDSFNILGRIDEIGSDKFSDDQTMCLTMNYVYGALSLNGVANASVDMARGVNMAGVICDDIGYCDFDFADFEPASAPELGSLGWAKQVGSWSTNHTANAKSVAAAADGGSFATGTFTYQATFGQGEPNQTVVFRNQNGSFDTFVARYNADGTLAWAKAAGGTMGDEGMGIAAMADGTSFVTGYFGGTAVFGPGEPGQTTLYSEGGSDIFIAKYNPDGTLAWVTQAGGISTDEGHGIAVMADGSLFVTGIFRDTASFGEQASSYKGGEIPTVWLTSEGKTDIFVARYNSTTGKVAWAKKAGGSDFDGGSGIAVMADGSSVVTGYFSGVATFGSNEQNQTTLTSAGGYDIFAARYDGDGNLTWAKRLGDASYDFGTGIAVMSDGSSVVSGSLSWELNPILWNLSSNGTQQWLKTVGDGVSGNGSANAVAALPDGGSAITGQFTGTMVFGAGEANATTLTTPGDIDDAGYVFVARYNADGTLLWAKQAGSEIGTWDKGNAISATSDGEVLAAGYFQGSAEFNFETVLLGAINQQQMFIAKYLEIE